MIQNGGACLSIPVSGRQRQEEIDKLKGSIVYTASAKPQATRRIEKQKQNKTQQPPNYNTNKISMETSFLLKNPN